MYEKTEVMRKKRHENCLKNRKINSGGKDTITTQENALKCLKES